MQSIIPLELKGTLAMSGNNLEMYLPGQRRPPLFRLSLSRTDVSRVSLTQSAGPRTIRIMRVDWE